jgi:hypothetical protein
VNLDAIYGGRDRLAYLRSWVWSPEERPAQLETASDDGSKVWFNGAEVVAVNKNRGMKAGQDKADVTLRAGWNLVTLKVSQDAGHWTAAARVTDLDGKRASGLIYMDSPGALQAATADMKALGDQDRARRAAGAARDIVQAVGGDLASVRAALEAAKPLVPDAETRQAIDRKLAELAAAADHIVLWQYAGPYEEEGREGTELFEVAFAPEIPQQAAEVEWRRVPATGGAIREHTVDLAKFLGGLHRAAYLRTRVVSPRARAARLEIGSDDGVKVWLNGQPVHANNAARGLKAGDDKVPVQLREGDNDLLVKVTQGGGEWGLCLRVAGPEGEGIELRPELPSAKAGSR